ncbi:ADP-ribosylglycohydrolase family protein [Dyella japonica]|uniref:ADP-ribosylglycohydrolase family protein n=1 Tax=Dyella japonica TaxID=231455 RepID=UPI000AEBBEB1|nr:ADP-ribosylglycohydrolase family protein [Dyella japonica]
MENHESLYVRRDRLAGGLQGLLIGDALGVPYEFHDAADLPPLAAIEMEPPASFDRAHQGVPPGTWSDDGAQALCLLSSLLARDGLDLQSFAGQLLNWAEWGYLAVDGHVFDIGLQTQHAFHRLRAGISPEQAGPAGESDNGNGALMRVLPLALWHMGSDESLITLAAEQSLPTHGHPRSAVACAMLCLWARAELQTTPAPWSHAEARLRKLGPALGLPEEEVALVLDPANRYRVAGSGYVVDTLWSARVALEHAGDYAEAVRRAITFGNDTDTTAAVAGGIAGIRYGLHGIPPSWREQLRGQNIVADLQRSLLAHAAGRESHSGDAIRTSATHKLRIGTVELESGGKIGITFCPGKKQSMAMSGRWDRDLDTDLAAIKAWGATHLVTLIAPWEFEELGVTELPQRARAHGIHWHYAPILDGHIPGLLPEGADPSVWFDGVWPSILPQLRLALQRGEGVVVHCKGGLGRAGTVAALILTDQEPQCSAMELMWRIREARPHAIETVIQENYLRQNSCL